ncbi:MAG: SDR family oxidoreductase, partial [Planctomycetota bacterium JB042]
PRVEMVEADLAESGTLVDALAGAGAAYYLVHSMVVAGGAYADRDRTLARNFTRAAAEAGLERILYLGGLGETGDGLSRHLSSRREVEGALADGPVPVTVLRAAMIIGSGSASFEILRYLTERLPFMITPRWVKTRCQPIAIRDVLLDLVGCLERPETTGETYDIGGADVLTYAEIIRVTAAVRELPRRIIFPVPVLTPRLSSLWIHLVTPVPARIARPLAEGLRNEVVCRDRRLPEILPRRRLSTREAIEVALGRQSSSDIETSWSDAGVMPGDPEWAGGTVFEDPRSTEIDASPARVFRAVCRVGGGHGWYAADGLWRLRGMLDRLVGGPGLRRGRRHPERVSYGDALDFWRVTGVDRDRRLELRAEMKLPGVATLSFEIEPDPERPDRCTLLQTARFKPRGLLGLAYWYAVLPLHGIVFDGMRGGIKRAAEADAGEAESRGETPAATDESQPG